MSAGRIVYWMKTWNFGNSSGLLAAYGGSAIFYELQTLQPKAAKSATHK